MAVLELETIFLGISIIVSVLLYILNARMNRKRKKEEFAERAAIQSLSPLLVEIHSLEKACELLGRYPNNFPTLRRYFEPQKFLDRVSEAYVFLSNASFEQNSLNLLMLLYHANAVFDRLDEGSPSDNPQIVELARAIGEVTIPLRLATSHAIDVYRKEIGVRSDIDYPIPFEEVMLQIENALYQMRLIVSPEEKSNLSEQDEKTLDMIHSRWEKQGDL